MASFVLRPAGTYVGELDLALQAKAISTSLGAAVITSRRGPEEDHFETRVEIFDALYGPPDASWSFAHYCIRKFLTVGQGCWLTRVTNSARFAGGMLYNDQEGALGNTTYYAPFTSGRFAGYATGSQPLVNYKLSSPLESGQTISITFNNGQTVSPTPQTVTAIFDGTTNKTSDETLAALAAAIQVAMNNHYVISGENAGQAYVNTIGVDANDDTTLTIVAPQNTPITVTSFTVTNGTIPQGQTAPVIPTVTEYDDALVLEVYAQNRGAWSSDPAHNGVGFRIANVDNGTNQRILFQLSQALTTSQSLAIKFTFHDPVTNAEVDQTITTPAFGTGGLNTPVDVANYLIQEYKILYPSGDGYILDNTDLQIVFVAPEAGPSVLNIINPTVVQPQGSQNPIPTFAVSEFLEGIASTQSFDVEVYTKADINEPVETWTCSLIHQINGNGEQLYVEDVINNNSVSASRYIRVKHNQSNLAGILNILPAGTDILWLHGGDDGVLPTSGDIIRTWDNYADRQQRPARIFINCGYTALSVQQKMASLARSRYDAIAVLDFPSDLQEVQAAFEYRTTTMNLNTSYAAIYLPDIQIEDDINNKVLFIPPSGHVAAVYANTDNVAASWFAPAGLNRAIIDDALGLRVLYNANDMGLLISGQLNPIINRGGDIVIWEQFTAYRRTSPFQNVSLRRMLILIEVSVVDSLDYTIQEPNDDYTGMLIVQIAVSILQPIQEGRGLYAYAAISDDRNNTNLDYDRQNRNLDLLMDPILPIRTIQLTSVITNKGASFAEVLNAITSTNLATSVS